MMKFLQWKTRHQVLKRRKEVFNYYTIMVLFFGFWTNPQKLVPAKFPNHANPRN